MKRGVRDGWLGWCTALSLWLSLLPSSLAQAEVPMVSESRSSGVSAKRQRTVSEPKIHQFIVKLRTPLAAEKVAALGATRMAALSATAGMRLKSVRPMSGGASVVASDEGSLTLARAKEVAARLAADPAVEYAEPDMPVRRFATPTDTGYAGRQWNMQVPGSTFSSITLTGGADRSFTNRGGANFQTAWDSTQGQSTVRVAVIDGGVVLTQADLAGATLLPGYDFISTNINGLPANFVANDGDGRDADPSDPGDWVSSADKATYAVCDDGVAGDTNSSWHGTHMAGLIAAQWGNSMASGTSTAGGAPNVSIVPVRVLGKCGGQTSDVIDAMLWAAGNNVTGVPDIASPVHVVSLSLGGGSCSTAMQNAVNAVVAANVTIVAATGNEAGALVAPASCNGVIAVTAHVLNGENADYANVGAATTVSAPGGGLGTLLTTGNPTAADSAYYIWSTVLYGPQGPGSTYFNSGSCSSGCTGSAISGFTGTSPATAQVSAAVALMLSVNPALTPAQIKAHLRASAQPHPSGGFCEYATNQCGAGLLDAARAVSMVSQAAPIVDAGADQRVAAGSTVTLSGSATAQGIKTISSYQWSVESGTAVSVTGATSASASFTAPSAGDTVQLRLTATDSAAVSGYDFVLVRVNVPPTLSAHSTSGTAGQALNLTIAGSDADFDALTYTVAGGSSLPSGAVLASNGVLSWSSPAVGTYAFNVVASDGVEAAAPATVTLVIRPVPKGGGGALPLWTVALLMVLALAVRRVRQN